MKHPREKKFWIHKNNPKKISLTTKYQREQFWTHEIPT